jgi:hypothetical protein
VAVTQPTNEKNQKTQTKRMDTSPYWQFCNLIATQMQACERGAQANVTRQAGDGVMLSLKLKEYGISVCKITQEMV